MQWIQASRSRTMMQLLLLLVLLVAATSQPATQFLPEGVSVVSNNVTGRLVYRSLGFMVYWNDTGVRKVVLQGPIVLEPDAWRANFAATGGVATLGADLNLTNYTITSDPCAAINCMRVPGTADVQDEQQAAGKPGVVFSHMPSAMLVGSRGHLAFENVALTDIAPREAYVFSPRQPWNNVAVGYLFWPTIALAPGGEVTLTNVEVAYLNPSRFDNCQQYTAKGVFNMRQQYGNSSTTRLNATAFQVPASLQIRVAVLDGAAANATEATPVGWASATYNNVTFNCEDPSQGGSGGLSTGALVAAIVVPVAVVALLLSALAAFLLRRRRRQRRRRAEAACKAAAAARAAAAAAAWPKDLERGPAGDGPARCQDLQQGRDQQQRSSDETMPSRSTRYSSTYSGSYAGSSAANSSSSTTPAFWSGGAAAAAGHARGEVAGGGSSSSTGSGKYGSDGAAGPHTPGMPATVGAIGLLRPNNSSGSGGSHAAAAGDVGSSFAVPRLAQPPPAAAFRGGSTDHSSPQSSRQTSAARSSLELAGMSGLASRLGSSHSAFAAGGSTGSNTSSGRAAAGRPPAAPGSQEGSLSATSTPGIRDQQQSADAEQHSSGSDLPGRDSTPASIAAAGGPRGSSAGSSGATAAGEAGASSPAERYRGCAGVKALLKDRSDMAVLRDLKLGVMLGRGSYGRVFKGRWRAVTVAVKIVEHHEGTAGTASSGGKRINVGREAMLATSILHPNVVQTYHISTMSVAQRNALAASWLSDPLGSAAASGSRRVARGDSSRNLMQAAGGAAAAPRGSPSGSAAVAAAAGRGAGSGGSGGEGRQLEEQAAAGADGPLRQMDEERSDGSQASNSSSNDGDQPELLETWMIMEFCEKGSLERAISHGTFIRRCDRQPEMIGIYKALLDTASGLDFLHSIGVVHGDLKAANVLLKGSTRDVRGFACKITDFGLSRVLDMDATHISTRTYGTIVYMPAELLLHGRMTQATDIYSFGLMMWELLCSTRVFDEALSIGQIFYMIAYQSWRPQVPPNCPPGYAELMQQCWASEPEERPTARQVLRSLQKLYVQEKQAQAASKAAEAAAAERGSGGSAANVPGSPAAAAAAGPSSGDRLQQRPGRHTPLRVSFEDRRGEAGAGAGGWQGADPAGLPAGATAAAAAATSAAVAAGAVEHAAAAAAAPSSSSPFSAASAAVVQPGAVGSSSQPPSPFAAPAAPAARAESAGGSGGSVHSITAPLPAANDSIRRSFEEEQARISYGGNCGSGGRLSGDFGGEGGRLRSLGSAGVGSTGSGGSGSTGQGEYQSWAQAVQSAGSEPVGRRTGQQQQLLSRTGSTSLAAAAAAAAATAAAAAQQQQLLQEQMQMQQVILPSTAAALGLGSSGGPLVLLPVELQEHHLQQHLQQQQRADSGEIEIDNEAMPSESLFNPQGMNYSEYYPAASMAAAGDGDMQTLDTAAGSRVLQQQLLGAAAAGQSAAGAPARQPSGALAAAGFVAAIELAAAARAGAPPPQPQQAAAAVPQQPLGALPAGHASHFMSTPQPALMPALRHQQQQLMQLQPVATAAGYGPQAPYALPLLQHPSQQQQEVPGALPAAAPAASPPAPPAPTAMQPEALPQAIPAAIAGSGGSSTAGSSHPFGLSTAGNSLSLPLSLREWSSCSTGTLPSVVGHGSQLNLAASGMMPASSNQSITSQQSGASTAASSTAAAAAAAAGGRFSQPGSGTISPTAGVGSPPPSPQQQLQQRFGGSSSSAGTGLLPQQQPQNYSMAAPVPGTGGSSSSGLQALPSPFSQHSQPAFAAAVRRPAFAAGTAPAAADVPSAAVPGSWFTPPGVGAPAAGSSGVAGGASSGALSGAGNSNVRGNNLSASLLQTVQEHPQGQTEGSPRQSFDTAPRRSVSPSPFAAVAQRAGSLFGPAKDGS